MGSEEAKSDQEHENAGGTDEKHDTEEDHSHASESPLGKTENEALDHNHERDEGRTSKVIELARNTRAKVKKAAEQLTGETKKTFEKTTQATREAFGRTVEVARTSAGELVGKIRKTTQKFESETASGKLADEHHGRVGHIAYLLFALGPLTGVASLFGLILSYHRRREEGVRDTLLRSHFRWLIYTFWLGIGAILICALLAWLFGTTTGFVALIVALIWYAHRIVKGWLSLYDGKEIANPAALL